MHTRHVDAANPGRGNQFRSGHLIPEAEMSKRLIMSILDLVKSDCWRDAHSVSSSAANYKLTNCK